MNFFEAQDFFKQMYPGKEMKFSFDQKCHRFYEIVITDGKPNPIHHVENNKVKVEVSGMDPIYVPIQPHREVYNHADMMNLIIRLNQNP
jgi:hypothetical protein